METSEINQGKEIEILFEKSGLSVTKFAERIGISREHVYRIFKQKRIKPYLLEKIMMVLGQQEPAREGAKEPVITYTNIREDDRKQLVKEIEYLKQRVKDMQEIIEAKNDIISNINGKKKRD